MILKRLKCIIATIFLICVSYADAGKLSDKKYEAQFDIYGVNKTEEKSIFDNYSVFIKEYVNASLPDVNHIGHIIDEKKAKIIHDKIIFDLKKTKNYSYVNLTNIIYPDKRSLYITLDLVKSIDKKRNIFNAEPTETVIDKSGLIQKWMEYEEKGWSMMMKGKVKLYLIECQALHCMFGFDQPELKPYLPIFNKVSSYVSNIKDILYYDKSPQKRATAALLLGHLKSADQIIAILTPAMDDVDSSVRNNALRVIFTSILKDRNANSSIPIDELLKGIDDPAAEDRGKALAILTSYLSKTKKYNQYIKNRSGTTLLNLLELKQLSNHNGAYAVLRLISGKNYSDTDIKSWKKWLDLKST